MPDQAGLPDDRSQILPTPSVPKTPGIFGPDYSFADNIKLPGQVGVRDGNDLESVIDSLKASAYYIDMIGFGQSSSPLSAGKGVKPLGVNTWIRTGFQCSNGADAWSYNSGVPTGKSMGKGVANGLESAGLPPLKGLAPGIVEDAQDALDPMPIIGAIFGSGYPQCSFQIKPVGDQDGLPMNPATKNYYVDNPNTLVNADGTPWKEGEGKPAYQGRWVKTADMSQTDWAKAPKSYCPDGYPKANHTNRDCNKPLTSTRMSGFCGSSDNCGNSDMAQMLMLSFIVVGGIILAGTAFRSRK